jgi:prepilin-type N-terminal cleavage/methylation domain-containing protein
VGTDIALEGFRIPGPGLLSTVYCLPATVYCLPATAYWLLATAYCLLMNTSTDKQKGFTLLEMLVALAVIAILAAIALPVLTRSRSRADRTACLSNVRQIGLAVSTYLDDWDGTYPAAWNEWNTPRYAGSGPYPVHGPGIVETLLPHGATPELWRCPADTGLNLHFNDYWMSGPNRPFWKDGGTSYFYRDMGSLDLAPAWPDPRNSALATRRTSVVAQPGRVVLLMDVMPWHAPPSGARDYLTWTGLTVALYCDGHAAARPWIEVRGNIDEAPGNSQST